MDVNRMALILTSEDPETLFSFYHETLSLPKAVGSGPGPLEAGGQEQAGGAVQVGGAVFIIEGHSDTKGRAKEPQRHLVDLHVNDVAAEQKRLQDLNVHFVRTAEREFWGGVIATFLDPDGNYVQLIQDPSP